MQSILLLGKVDVGDSLTLAVGLAPVAECCMLGVTQIPSLNGSSFVQIPDHWVTSSLRSLVLHLTLSDILSQGRGCVPGAALYDLAVVNRFELCA